MQSPPFPPEEVMEYESVYEQTRQPVSSPLAVCSFRNKKDGIRHLFLENTSYFDLLGI